MPCTAIFHVSLPCMSGPVTQSLPMETPLTLGGSLRELHGTGGWKPFNGTTNLMISQPALPEACNIG